MGLFNHHRKPGAEFHENDRPTFVDKFRDLLPGVEFEEPLEMLLARDAVLTALARDDQSPDSLRFVWAGYTYVSEQAVDSKTPNDASTRSRAQFQVAALIHKALIHREVGDMQLYRKDLSYAEWYAMNGGLDEIVSAIGEELDNL